MSEPGWLIDPQSVRFERLFAQPLVRVWQYLTRPACLQTWLAEVQIDLRVGGAVELRFAGDEVPERAAAGAVIHGVIHQCEAPCLLSFSWVDAAVDSVVTFELEPCGDDVLLVLTHRGLPPRLTPTCAAEWDAHLEILAARLGGGVPQPFAELFERLQPLYDRQVTQVRRVAHG